MIIAALIYELASDAQKEVLKNEYKVSTFAIETIKLERIFIDKVFATEFYFTRREYFDTAKHLYDIVV
ncbi:MAG: hypothetical protein IMZ64_14450 [Bacteroidetes bacterium]|nr:hypothetical protein [Bacteroidota bacterium]